jgi:hypothetical protein
MHIKLRMFPPNQAVEIRINTHLTHTHAKVEYLTSVLLDLKACGF